MAKVIMVQGTTSNAGKSFLVAALCRIFKQDGYRVVPFKAQNMALNSYITREGLEMGRAQVMQAEAAGVEPDVRMNPILLKPTNDTGSQVIVMGEVLGNMPAREYFQYKKELFPTVQAAFDSLAKEADIVVIEGAGSPAEINLKAHDLVNMGMARMAQSPVLLVADIDRGGVFASLAGTLMLLDEDEKAMIRGLVINKFRGDKTILDPGVVSIEEITQKTVVGVLPYMKVDIDDEDSLSERLTAQKGPDLVDVAVIRLPRISNFTDFNPLESIAGLSLRYVSTVRELGHPDLIILPGTKNTMGDLLWLRQSGLEAAVQKHAAAGGLVLGICGGYQMLGQRLEDPHGVEGGGSMQGLGLLPAVTVFEEAKNRTRIQGHFLQLEGEFACFSGIPFDGYEIHMGRTDPTQEGEHALSITRRLEKDCDHADGLYHENVLGCYVHGLFDREEPVRALATLLYHRKGLDPTLDLPDPAAYKEEQYDILAAGVRANLDMNAVYQILEEGL